jgi:hypothetical protein
VSTVNYVLTALGGVAVRVSGATDTHRPEVSVSRTGSIRRSLGVGVASFTVLAAAMGVAPGVASGLTNASPAASQPQHVVKYVKAVQLCKTPKAGHASCFAMHREVVKAGTPGARAMTMTVQPGYATGPAGSFTPADLATAYAVNPAATTTATVGIVDAYNDPNALTDLNTFDAHYGLAPETSTSFKKVSQTGSTTVLPVADSGWAAEESLDLDAVRGLCKTCKIILVEANSNSFSDLAAAENEAVTLGANVISNSYGGAESGAIPLSILSAYTHSGVVITASTGDNGMFDWDNYNVLGGVSSNAPEIPSSLNTVVAVGGTTMYLNSDATRSAETVWNENGSSDLTGYYAGRMGATGGGCSTQVTGQLWQRAVSNYSQTTCGSRRLAADIAALADPFTGYDIYDTYGYTGWMTFGGTSLASPLIAAMWGLAGGSGGVANPSLSLYGHFKSDTSHPLYDVTAGGNGLCDGTPATACQNFIGSPPNTLGRGTLDCAWLAGSATLAAGTRECDAATGYDGPSGVGTPIGLNTFKAMGPTAKVTLPASVSHGVSASFSGSTSTDPFPGGTITTYAWTFGDGGTASSSSSSTSHTYAAAGTYSLTLKVTDNYSRTGSVAVSVVVK